MSLTNSILCLFEITDPNLIVTGISKERCSTNQRIHVVMQLCLITFKVPTLCHKSLLKRNSHESPALGPIRVSLRNAFKRQD
ncbi:hypothetical protein, partial [Pediococcus damnosus]|uniref:hypothetical protein n=1 Tax=Pediococcus damnosus TaxID=51663 RepID=UPI0018742C8C